ncbi:hypothetical protein T4E_4073 [Trichinella pseudospiralis]|uniref:Uncharacterized protein n=1 Tax=Trichinella pseudospiralis TaxID=6337 RepID=A0A0V0YDE6_TRIPS|nr:hypothetical protein T4E_4073 [Trichinella pseudospiralis]
MDKPSGQELTWITIQPNMYTIRTVVRQDIADALGLTEQPQKENYLAAEVHDSLRHAALFTVKAKMLFQSLWTLGLTSVTVNLMITRSQVASIKKQTGIYGGIAIRQIGKIFKKGDYPAYPQNKLLMRQHGGSLLD